MARPGIRHNPCLTCGKYAIFQPTEHEFAKVDFKNEGCAMIGNRNRHNILKVFISSTGEDLIQHREKVVEAVRTMGHHPVSMDAFGSIPGRPLDESLRQVESSDIRRMARNPVMLTSLCVVHWHERRLPKGKADLLKAVLRWMLKAREEKREEFEYDRPFTEECLKTLAFRMTDHKDGKRVVAELPWAAEQLTDAFISRFHADESLTSTRAEAFLRFEMLESGIIVQAEKKEGQEQLRFDHLTFQEHYAARELTGRLNIDGPEGWWTVLSEKIYDRQWTEVVDHFAALLMPDRRKTLDFFLEKILKTYEHAPEEQKLVRAAEAVGVIGRLLMVLGAYKYDPPPDLGWQEARSLVMGIFEHEGAAKVPVETRIKAAEALGRAGDPRFHHHKRDENWLPVPGMPELRLGKYPVTVMEYDEFIKNDGYDNPEFWPDSWEVRIKENWSKPDRWTEQLETPNWPVTGISWYEATAYCSWLSKVKNENFRLPTGNEWEKAATDPGGGKYPWGDDEPDEERANFDNNVDHPTPVGIYPAGAAPGGHLDMAGNVWEWCVDDVGEFEGVPLCALRGGCFWDVASHLRSSYRSGDHAGRRLRRIGFRVAAAPLVAKNNKKGHTFGQLS